MLLRRLTLLVAVLAATVAAVSSAVAASTQTERRAGLELAVVREVNQIRAAHGLRALVVSSGLHASALTHSRAMLDGGFFDHTSPDGTPFYERIRKAYPQRPNERWRVGENLFATSGALTARETVAAWLASPAHRDILLSAAWREIGVAVVRSPLAEGDFGGLPTWLATADFGSRAAPS